jgi:hypothetical protein
LERIAWCESNNRHFNENGGVLRGKIDKDDIGRYQINLRYHKKEAENLGIDLFSEEGNRRYAELLYEKRGTDPWRASQKCWGVVTLQNQ